jgi:hypothetical protein
MIKAGRGIFSALIITGVSVRTNPLGSIGCRGGSCFPGAGCRVIGSLISSTFEDLIFSARDCSSPCRIVSCGGHSRVTGLYTVEGGAQATSSTANRNDRRLWKILRFFMMAWLFLIFLLLSLGKREKTMAVNPDAILPV